MSHQRRNGQDGGPAHQAPGTAGVMLVIAAWLAATDARAQEAPAGSRAPRRAVRPPGPGHDRRAAAPIIVSSPAAPIASSPTGDSRGSRGGPGAPDSAAPPVAPVLEPDVQVVRFQGPPGLTVDVLAPAPIPVPIGDGGGIITVGLKRGVGYRLRVRGIVERPMAELYPVVEIVGHLHRPEDIDPGKYPIRVVFNQDDMDDAVDRGRLVTKVIYLEDPDQAIPFKMAKDEVPVITLNPTEPPLRVASALGRPVAIVRIGGRRPTNAEIQGGVAGDIGLDWAESIGSKPCPFLGQSGARCSLPCGPVCVPSPPPARPSLPRDEYLCDGGDRATPAAPNANGRITGVDPRDAIVRFDIGVKGVSRKHESCPPTWSASTRLDSPRSA